MRFEDDSPQSVALTAAMVGQTNADTEDKKAETEVRKAKAALWRHVGYGVTSLGIGAGAWLALLGYSFIPATKTVVIHDQPAPVAPPAAQAPLPDQATNDPPRPTPRQFQPDARPPSKAKVVTNFTIFHTTEFAGGRVETGWKFEDSNQAFPSYQYCHFVQPSQNTFVTIGEDGRMALPKTGLRGVDLQAAYANCVWASADVKAASAK